MTESGQQTPEPRSDAGDGWRVFSYMIAGMIFYGALGWLIGHFTGISILFPLGMILGIAVSVAGVIVRFSRS